MLTILLTKTKNRPFKKNNLFTETIEIIDGAEGGT